VRICDLHQTNTLVLRNTVCDCLFQHFDYPISGLTNEARLTVYFQ
jgi:hypothetical protein